MKLTPKQNLALSQIRRAGFPVVVWTPDDVRAQRPAWTAEQCAEFLTANRQRIEDNAVEFWWALLPRELEVAP